MVFRRDLEIHRILPDIRRGRDAFAHIVLGQAVDDFEVFEFFGVGDLYALAERLRLTCILGRITVDLSDLEIDRIDFDLDDGRKFKVIGHIGFALEHTRSDRPRELALLLGVVRAIGAHVARLHRQCALEGVSVRQSRSEVGLAPCRVGIDSGGRLDLDLVFCDLEAVLFVGDIVILRVIAAHTHGVAPDDGHVFVELFAVCTRYREFCRTFEHFLIFVENKTGIVCPERRLCTVGIAVCGADRDRQRRLDHFKARRRVGDRIVFRKVAARGDRVLAHCEPLRGIFAVPVRVDKLALGDDIFAVAFDKADERDHGIGLLPIDDAFLAVSDGDGHRQRLLLDRKLRARDLRVVVCQTAHIGGESIFADFKLVLRSVDIRGDDALVVADPACRGDSRGRQRFAVDDLALVQGHDDLERRLGDVSGRGQRLFALDRAAFICVGRAYDDLERGLTCADGDKIGVLGAVRPSVREGHPVDLGQIHRYAAAVDDACDVRLVDRDARPIDLKLCDRGHILCRHRRAVSERFAVDSPANKAQPFWRGRRVQDDLVAVLDRLLGAVARHARGQFVRIDGIERGDLRAPLDLVKVAVPAGEGVALVDGSGRGGRRAAVFNAYLVDGLARQAVLESDGIAGLLVVVGSFLAAGRLLSARGLARAFDCLEHGIQSDVARDRDGRRVDDFAAVGQAPTDELKLFSVLGSFDGRLFGQHDRRAEFGFRLKKSLAFADEDHVIRPFGRNASCEYARCQRAHDKCDKKFFH